MPNLSSPRWPRLVVRQLDDGSWRIDLHDSDCTVPFDRVEGFGLMRQLRKARAACIKYADKDESGNPVNKVIALP